MRCAVLPLTLALFASPLLGQDEEHKRPEGWKVRFDRAGQPDTAVYFVTMTPGWHITTGPPGILYNPETTAERQFRVQSTISLFDPGRRQREAYGILFGGQNLSEPSQSYSYFMIRNTGDFLIKRRNGSGTSTVRDWAPSAAIVRQDGGAENAKNVLVVQAGAQTVDFIINGEKVATVPRSELQVDGVVGLRVNHSLNLHVSQLTIERES